jgi:hypothetical protein
LFSAFSRLVVTDWYMVEVAIVFGACLLYGTICSRESYIVIADWIRRADALYAC